MSVTMLLCRRFPYLMMIVNLHTHKTRTYVAPKISLQGRKGLVWIMMQAQQSKTCSQRII